MRRLSSLLLILTVFAGPARAFENLDGYFIAEQTCEAYQSKNKQTNPGNITTVPRTAYDMIGINKPGGDFFQVRVPGAPVTDQRWVSASCGVHAIRANTPTTTTTTGTGTLTPQPGAESADNLLTLSWQPAFCETRPAKTECRNLNGGLLPFATRQLSIHGLWPQPKSNIYCGVPASIKSLDNPDTWHALPAPDIDTDTADDLMVAMPGTASDLQNHEWIKHGTCYHGAGGADEYFDDMLRLTDAVNSSAVGEFFANNVGNEVSAADIRARFDEAFGAGTGARVNVKCVSDGGRRLVTELWISLKGTITPDIDPGTLMLAADETTSACSRGIIDPSGLQ